MIKTGFGFIASVFLILAVYLWFFGKYGDKKIFKYIPSVIILYVGIIGAATLGLWDYSSDAAVLSTKNTIMNMGVPMLIYLACVSNDARKIAKLGPKLLGVYVMTAVSIVLGIVIAAVIFVGKLNIPEVGGTFGALTGSFIGGPENLYAVANTVEMSDGALANTLMLVYVVFTPWMLFLIAGLPLFAKKFNKWTKVDLTVIEESANRIGEGETTQRHATATDVFILIAVGATIEALGFWIGSFVEALIPSMTSTIVMYIIVTIASLLLGCYSKLGQNPAVSFMMPVFAYVMLFMGAIGVDFGMFKDAGYFLATSVTAILIHVILVVIYAKIAKADLYSLGCASIACIGGNSSAAVVATAYGNKAYITIATVMASIGPIIGTFIGLGVCHLLNIII